MAIPKEKKLNFKIGKTNKPRKDNGKSSSTSVTAAQRRLAQHMAVLETKGFDSLDALGKLEIGVGNRSHKKPILITSGIALPDNNPVVEQDIQVDLREAKFAKEKGKIVQADVLKATPLLQRGADATARANILIDVSYWFANEVIIGDDTDLVIDSSLNSVFIIAKKISLGKNVSITWLRPGFEDISRPAKPATPPGYPTADGLWVYPGRAGTAGKNGNPGAHGQSAPEMVEFWFLEKDGPFPAIDLRGQDGQQGGRGGHGGDGGEGQKGCPTKKKMGFCNQGQGRGGDGGNGGNGGRGGRGGNGGDGGVLAVYTLEDNILAINQAGLTVDLNEGRGGPGGKGGNGGQGGPGGEKGDKVHKVCPRNDRKPGKRGYDGKTGNSGSNGAPGRKLPNHLSFNPITTTEFNIALTKPAIISTNKQGAYAFAGETISVTGVRFVPGDQVFIENYEGDISMACSTNFVAENLLTFVVPRTVGGRLNFQVQQLDGTVSIDRGTLLIAPRITKIVSGSRIRPGTDIFIKGTGFDRSGVMELNGEHSSSFEWIDYETIKCKVVRPYGIDRNAAGEAAKLKVINTEGRGPNNYNHSNELDVTLDTYRICVFGDSVAWNGGTAEHHKYYSLVRDYIESKYDIGVYLSVEAHHGAIIGRGKHQQYDKLHGELSTDFPTINQQVDLIAGQPDAAAVDMVLHDGGANDSEIASVMLKTDANDLQQLAADFKADIERYSYHDFKDLLLKTLNAFPNAEVLPFGYYHIFSEKSEPSKITLFSVTMYAAVNDLTDQQIRDYFLGTFEIPNLSSSDNFNKVITLNDLWVTDSTKWMKKAVAEANHQIDGRNRAHFVDLETKPEHAAHAPNSLLWEPVKENLLLKASDERISEREDLMEEIKQDVQNGDRSKTDLKARGYSALMTKRNSSYHPNPAGARWMFDKMRPILDELKMPQQVVLQTTDKYLSVNQQTEKLQLTNGSIADHTALTMIDMGAGKMALKSTYGKFVCAEHEGGSEVNVNRPKPRPWEILELVKKGNGRYCIKTANGHYFKVGTNGVIDATADTPNTAAEFVLV